ncbi:MAG: gliding-associated putative ABC transporter substrate-binding component GldG [Salibacteraceae bacterium]|jgi:gliding-associated putative ABC transporter substrate-binding component GldG
MNNQTKKTTNSLYNWTILGIVLAAVILVNVISSFWYKRMDVTEDQRYSLTESTKEFLQKSDSFKGRISIKIYLAGELPAEIEHFRVAIEDKLKEFKVHAGDRIEYQFINPSVGSKDDKRELEDRLFDAGKGILPMNLTYTKDGSERQITLWPGAILDYGGAGTGSKKQAVQLMPGTNDKRPFPLENIGQIIQNSTKDLEYMLVSALRRVIQESKPRIGFLQGHGELTFAQTQRARAVINPYYSVSDVELNDSLGALNEFDGLVIARPTQKFSNKDLYLIDQFVMRGGRLMCFLDKLSLPMDTLNRYGVSPTTRIETGLDKLLFDYGLKLMDNYMMDRNCLPKPVRMEKQAMIPWFFNVLATPTNHPIGRNLDPVSLEYTNEVQLVPSENNEYIVTPILTSSSNSVATGMAPQVSFMTPIEYGNEPLVPNPDNPNNAKCLAALSAGKFKSYFRTRIVDEFAKNPESNYLEKSKTEGKVLLVGNGRFFENRYDSMPKGLRSDSVFKYRPKLDVNDLKQNFELVQARYQHVIGNQEFYQNLTDFMMGEHSVMDIRSREIGIHAIDTEKVKADSVFYKLLNVGLPIVIILLLALVMNIMRKRKFSR